ncbi:response regulator [Halorhabdus amylolytica]|uniref:response regulator n=1 Tax=Halorhabdus amylolytica TaxID=2559573 RepID=UPI0010AA8617|nr:response regulator [Halorhabdus amylolytica]
MPESITVLLVDEDRDILDITATFLERESERLDVETVTRTAQALDVLETDPDAVDCVVSDYTMPGMTGVEFLETVRDHDPELPFFFFTGRDRSEIEAQLDADAIDGYVQKGTGTERYAELATDIVDTVDD